MIPSKDKTSRKTFSVSKQVEFCETDMAGIAHYSNVFRYVEYAETRFFLKAGMSICDFEKDQKWPIASVTCDFLGPMRFGDEINIALNVGRIGTRSVTLNFCISKNGDDGREEKLSNGTLTVIRAKTSGGSSGIKTAEIENEFRGFLMDYCSD